MDAKPQRPARPIHAQGDENTVVPTAKQPVVHQRNMSTGTINNMLTIGGIKAAAKRTAFNEKTNVSKVLTKGSEVSAIGIKVDSDKADKVEVAEKVISKDPDTTKGPLSEKPAALLRPAQRPLNGNGKTTLNAAAPPYVPSAIPVLPTQPAVKRNNTKKAPIYIDNAAPIEQAVTHPTEETVNYPAKEAASYAPQQNIVVPAPAQLNVGPRQHKSQPDLKPEQPILRRTQSKSLDGAAAEFQVGAALPIPHVLPPLPALPVLPSYQHVSEQHGHGAQSAASYQQKMEDALVAEYLEDEAPKIIRDTVTRMQQEKILAGAGELEEYSDGDSEEFYDEQGYTTAYSLRSRGDNTTGGITQVVVPKWSKKVWDELDAARIITNDNRSQEEVEDEAWDTSMVAEYGDEIFEYMRELELTMLPDPHYMDKQHEIQWSMRAVLMDWLVQVHGRFGLLPETLFLCVNFIDRFLTGKVVSLHKLQLVGAAALFLAAKYEEINCPSINEVIYMVDNGYTMDEIFKAERFMLTILDFHLGYPGPMSFLRRISKADEYDLETRTLAKYFLEVTIMDERFIGSPASFLAAGAHAYARAILQKGRWTLEHTYYSGYTWSQLQPLVCLIASCCVDPQKHHAAVFEKYSDRRYKRASQFVQAEMQQGFKVPPANDNARRARPSGPAPSYDDVAAQMPYETRESFKRMVQVKA